MLRRTGISLHICNDKDEIQIMPVARITSSATFVLYRGPADLMRACLQRSGLNYKSVICSFDSMITRLGMQTYSASATFDTVTESFKTRYPSWKSIPQLLSYFRNENHLKRDFDERVTAVRLLLGQNGQLSIMDLKNSIKTLESVCDSLVLNR